jgi:hypothetical protein
MQKHGRAVATIAVCGACAAAVGFTHSELIAAVALTFAIPVSMILIWYKA